MGVFKETGNGANKSVNEEINLGAYITKLWRSRRNLWLLHSLRTKVLRTDCKEPKDYTSFRFFMRFKVFLC